MQLISILINLIMKPPFATIFKLLVFCFLFSSSNTASAQYQRYEFVEAGKKNIYDGIGHRFQVMDIAYQNKQKSLDLYLKGRRRTKLSKYIAAGGSVSLGIGCVRNLNNILSGNDVNSGKYFIMVGLLTEVVALCVYLVGESNINKARELHYQEIESELGYLSRSTLLIGSTRNGVGLILKFG